jgi:hypothetical protein
VQTEAALRYLLLRHLKLLEPRVEPARFRAVTRSLAVTRTADGWKVTWEDAQVPHSRSVPASDFAFYVRGDRDPVAGAAEVHTANETAGRAFAATILGVDAPPDTPLRSTLAPRAVLPVIEAAIVAALLVTWGVVGLAAALLVIAAAAVEAAPGGKVIAGLALLALSAITPPGFTVLGGVTYAVLLFLDPDGRLRSIRVTPPLLAVALGLLHWVRGVPLLLDGRSIAATLLAAGIVVGRSLHGSHFLLLPLALPMFAAGVAWDGRATDAFVLLALLILTTIARNGLHRVLPVQRERRLPANG